MITPKKRILYEYAVDTFVELLSQVQRHDRKYRCNDLDVFSWNSFLDSFKDANIGKDFIFKFCQFGIQNWFKNCRSEAQKSRCRFYWIFSSKLVKTYKSIGGMKTAQYLIRNGKKEIGVSLVTKDRKCRLTDNGVYTSVHLSEERFKNEFHNTKKGMIWCITNTTLYNHVSPSCRTCKYSVDCKEVLKQNYSKIYRLRGYDK